MQVYKNLSKLPAFKNTVITIGTFDGVHIGHTKIIEQLIKEAAKVKGTAVLITFYPHPKKVIVSNKNPLFILSTQEEKYKLLAQKGIEHVVVVPFDAAFAAQPAKDYIKNFLVQNFHPASIIIGYDHRFGYNREGDFRLLEREASQFGFEVKEIPEKVLQDVTISSTKIRDALLDADITTAAAYLGYDYFFSGTVVKGNQLGRTIGYPTANIMIDDGQKLIPANGVYAVAVELLDGNVHKGMMNIGIRPTVNGIDRVTEVNIFGFDKMIYDEKIKVIIKGHIRDEEKFSGLPALKEQLAKDKIAAQMLLL